ncbi:MAG: TonB-dependent receptor [Akkermansiaceae bacterium]|nr:TonB-dependent receptor [Akkermansiaceae bacterium]
MKLISYLLTASTTAAIAQTELETLTVEAARERASKTVPTVAESKVELSKTAGGTEVVDSERYLTGRASTLADTFALSPGVFAQPRFGSDEARLSIRGSGLQRTFHGRGIRVLQDGVPVNLADGGFDMQSLEPSASRYINVWRGGNALAYGGSTLGGAIDYVSRNGRTDPGGFARLEAGSWNYFRGTLAGGFSNDATDAYSSFTWQSQDGFRDHAEQNNQRLFSNIGWNISDGIESRLYITGVLTDSQIPGSLSKAQLKDDPRDANPTNATGDYHRDFELYRIASKTTFTNGDNQWDLTASWTYKDLNHPIFQVIDQRSNDALLGVTFTNTSDLFSHENQVRAGVFLTRGVTHAAQFQNLNGTRGTLLSDSDQIATNLEAFVENQFTIGNGFTAILGASAAHNRREIERQFAGPPDYTYEYNEFAPKIGLRYDAENYQVYANVSGSYEPPSFSETYTANTARDAQTATSFELGTRGSWGFFRWDATAYHAEIEDELLTVIDPSTGLSTTTNADRTTHSGLEIGTEIDLLGNDWNDDPAHRLVFRTAWTYGRFEFDRHTTAAYDYSGNKIAGLPPHLIRGELLWQNDQGWYAGPTFEWVPVKSYVDHRNTLSADPYALVGFKFGRRQEQGLSWFIEARNLTDERYAATHDVVDNALTVVPQPARVFLPGDGRSVFGGLEWRW